VGLVEGLFAFTHKETRCNAHDAAALLSAVPGTLLICALLVADVSSFSSPASPLLGTRRVASSSSRWVIPSRASSPRRAPFLRMQPAGLADAPQPPAQDAWTAAALYACPQCGSGISLDDVSCPSCGAPISTNEGFTDLTPDATAPVAPAVEATDAQRFLDDLRKNPLVSAALSGGGLPLPGQPLRQELFRTPVLSFLYERGWRDGFKQARPWTLTPTPRTLNPLLKALFCPES
jgi:hypothetical protein